MWNQISEPIELALNKPLPTMWDSMLKAFCDVSDKASDVYLKRPKVRNDREHVGMCTSHIMSVGFNCMDEENADSLNILQRQGWSALWLKVEEQTSDPNILSKLRPTFEERFHYDEHGIPWVWKPEDDIDTAFCKAQDQVSTSLFALRFLLILVNQRPWNSSHCIHEFSPKIHHWNSPFPLILMKQPLLQPVNLPSTSFQPLLCSPNQSN